MKNNRLILILSSFSKKEMTYFKEFIDSPYFNKHKGVKALTDYFAKIYPNFTDKNCSSETIFKSLFGKEKFDKQKLALLFTYSMRLLEKFMAQESFNKKESNHEVLSNRFLCDKRHIKYATKQLKTLEGKLEKKSFEKYNYLDELLDVLRELYFIDGLVGKVLSSPHLDKKQQYLEYAFLSEKMRDACALLAGSPIVKKDRQPIFENFAVREVTENLEKYDSVPVVKTYGQIFKMLKTGEEVDYRSAKKIIDENENYFSLPERQSLYSYLQNFCVFKINRLESDFYNELFELYKTLLEKELIFENGNLNEMIYLNIVTVATRLNEREWVEDFMVRYKKRLLPERAENAYSFNLASYYFSIGELGKVQELLLQVEYTDPRYSLGAKVLLLKTYYHLEETEALFSLTDSFRQFLKRNNLLAESRKSGYANLFKWTRRTAKIRSRVGFVSKKDLRKDLEKLKIDFESADLIASAKWLQKEIGKIEVRIK